MDTEAKSVSWIGNVREKFESFCSEIDDIINQDPFEYAGNQLQSLGANVEQFCTKVMKEMLPGSTVNSLQEKTPPLENGNCDPADAIAKSTVKQEFQLLGNEVSSSGRGLSKESVDLNDGLDSCVLVDRKELHSTSYLLGQGPTSQIKWCKTCLTVIIQKDCQCQKGTSSKENNAESDQPEGKVLPQPSLTGESKSSDQDFRESDWVII